jgi:hypothetical protein
MKNPNSLLIFLVIVVLPKILFAQDSIIKLNFENNHFSGNLTEYQLFKISAMRKTLEKIWSSSYVCCHYFYFSGESMNITQIKVIE